MMKTFSFKPSIWFIGLTSWAWLGLAEASSPACEEQVTQQAQQASKSAASRMQQGLQACEAWLEGLKTNSSASPEEWGNAALLMHTLASNRAAHDTDKSKVSDQYQTAWLFAQRSANSVIQVVVSKDYGKFLIQTMQRASDAVTVLEAGLKAAQTSQVDILNDPTGSELLFLYATALRKNKQCTPSLAILGMMAKHLQTLEKNNNKQYKSDTLALVLNDSALCAEKLGNLDLAANLYLQAKDLALQFKTANSEKIIQNYLDFQREHFKQGLVNVVNGGMQMPAELN